MSGELRISLARRAKRDDHAVCNRLSAAGDGRRSTNNEVTSDSEQPRSGATRNRAAHASA